MKRTLKEYVGVVFRGLAMGAADSVPGVSGGTIAFITGIYQELIDTIKSINLTNIKKIKTEGLGGFWTAINGNFIVALGLGIAVSFLSLAKIVKGILDEGNGSQSQLALWSLFIGLVVASAIYVAKGITKWNAKSISAIIIGAAIAYYITILPEMGKTDNYLFLMFAGAIAISAMILPGVSGMFILILLGAYPTVLGIIDGLLEGLKGGDSAMIIDNAILASAVGFGMIIGLLTFSRVLSWLFKNQEQMTLALLTGFMIGSLNKLWPWKFVEPPRMFGEHKVNSYTNISIDEYVTTNGDSFMLLAIGCAILGFALVFGMEYLGKKMAKN